MERMNIGEFARQARMSPKALRLYDELGLLAPAHVDEDSRYRVYEAGQLERARLIAALRQLQMPLAEIKAILNLEPAVAAERVQEFWAAAELEHATRRALTSALVERLNGRRPVMYDVVTREIPDRRVLCLKRNVPDEPAVWALGKEFVALMREHRLPRIGGIAGAAFCIYWGEVSDDSDGPLEWCRPVPTGQAEAVAAQCPELTLRTEPAHSEAFIPLGAYGETSAAQWQLISQTMQAWAEGHRARPLDLGVRITYISNGTAGPDREFAVPIEQPST